jgi:hypothetical protein
MQTPGAAAVTASVALAALALAPLAGRAETIRPGEPNDNIDWTLGLFGHSVPEVLRTAKADPYAAPAAPPCETIPRELAALDAVLGPDADAPAAKLKMRARAEHLAVQGMMQGVRGMIPHRDWIRFATGAGRKDKALNDAAMAGWARRGFLKGMEVNLGCEGAPTPRPVAAPLPPAKPFLLRRMFVRTTTEPRREDGAAAKVQPAPEIAAADITPTPVLMEIATPAPSPADLASR